MYCAEFEEFTPFEESKLQKQEVGPIINFIVLNFELIGKVVLP